MVENKELNTGKTEEETSDGSVESGEATEELDISKPQFKDLDPASPEEMKHNLDLLMDVTVPVTVELGQSRLKIENILQMGPGSVIELDKHADEPVDLKVNGKLMAKGEIVVVDDYFGIRICEIIDLGDMEG